MLIRLKLERRLGKQKDGMMALQSHMAFLNSEVERLEKEKEVLQKSQDASVKDLALELNEYRKAYKLVKRRLELLCTKVWLVLPMYPAYIFRI